MGNQQINKRQTQEPTIAIIPHHWTFSNLQQSVSIMSYNVLADCYCDQSYFPYAQSITIDDRASRVIKTILDLNPDIIAFQEVDHFDDIYNGSLESQYELRFYQRPTRQDGLLMGWKKDLYEMIEESLMDYDEQAKKSGKDEEYMRHNIAQLITLKQIKTGRLFQVANTHIFWNPRNENVKYHQMIQLMGIIAKQEQRHPLMICGDFNSLPHSNVIQFILNKIEPNEQRTEYSNKKIMGQMIQDYNDVSQNIDQFRQLCSAYYLNDKHPKYTTYVQKFIGNIDYIFYDKEFLRVGRLLDIPNEKTVTQEQFLPNSIFPSDHLPLMVEFIFQ